MFGGSVGLRRGGGGLSVLPHPAFSLWILMTYVGRLGLLAQLKMNVTKQIIYLYYYLWVNHQVLRKFSLSFEEFFVPPPPSPSLWSFKRSHEIVNSLTVQISSIACTTQWTRVISNQISWYEWKLFDFRVGITSVIPCCPFFFDHVTLHKTLSHAGYIQTSNTCIAIKVLLSEANVLPLRLY